MVKFSFQNGSLKQANEIERLKKAKADADKDIERFQKDCDDLRVSLTNAT